MIEVPRQTFFDITRGKSSGIVGGRPAYVKHLSYADQLGFDLKREEYFAEARADGAPTNEERLKEMRAAGEWDDKRETEIEAHRRTIEGLAEGRRTVKHPSQVESLIRQTKEEQEKLVAALNAKYALMGITCEAYADKQINDYYICTNIYGDETLTQPLLPPHQFNHLCDDEVSRLVADYNAIIDRCTDLAIKRLAIQPFFQRYFALVGDHLSQFFGKPICEMTFYQIELLRYGVHFRNVLSSTDLSQAPKGMLDDPDALTDYANTVKRGRQDLEQQGAFEEGAIVMGGKKSDDKALGVKPGGINLREEMAKNGGQLGMDFFAKMAR